MMTEVAILVQNQLMTQKLELLNKEINKFVPSTRPPQSVRMVAPPQQPTCEMCGIDHIYAQCPYATAEGQVQYVSNQGRQGNFSNQPFRANNFSNFNTGWNSGQPQGGWKQHAGSSNKSPFTPLSERTTKLEDTLEKFIQVSMLSQQKIEVSQKNTEASLKNLETQMGQMAKQLADMAQSPFSANTQTNLKEYCNSITTSSGKVIGEGIGDDVRVNDEELSEKVLKEKEKNEKESEKNESSKKLSDGVRESDCENSEKENKDEEDRKYKEWLKAKVEALHLKYLPYPPVHKKENKEPQISNMTIALHEEKVAIKVCRKEVPIPPPPLPPDEKIFQVDQNPEMQKKEFPPPYDD